MCFEVIDDPMEGYLRSVRSMRSSEAPLPSTALKRSSDRFVFLDLYRDRV
jgi:hypothetical protein